MPIPVEEIFRLADIGEAGFAATELELADGVTTLGVAGLADGDDVIVLEVPEFVDEDAFSWLGDVVPLQPSSAIMKIEQVKRKNLNFILTAIAVIG